MYSTVVLALLDVFNYDKFIHESANDITSVVLKTILSGKRNFVDRIAGL